MNIKQALTGIGATAALVVGVNLNTAEAASDPLPHWVTTSCVSEDSVDCYWDAHQQGNKVGHSYIVHEFRNQGNKPTLICVMYVERAYARHHDYCISE